MHGTGVEKMNFLLPIRIILCILLMMTAHCTSAIAVPLTISHVFSDPASMNNDALHDIRIHYRLSKRAKTIISIFDSRDYLIKEIRSDDIQSVGDHIAVWNGRDKNGTPVPAGYYVFTVEAQSRGEETVRYDLTDLTGGKLLPVPQAAYDSEQAAINYILPAPALVNIRIGLPDGGPLLATVVDWVARPGGRNFESWDGWTHNKTVNIKDMNNYQIGVSAYSLPNNSIIIYSPEKQNRPEFVRKNAVSGEKRNKKSPRKLMYNHWQHDRDMCYDPAIHLSFPPQLKHLPDGTPVVQGPVTIKMNVAERDESFTFNQRFEVVYYADFVFVCEEELGYTPFNWEWNPQGVNEGVHYITVMLRGYEGHFGTITEKVFVKKSPSQHISSEN